MSAFLSFVLIIVIIQFIVTFAGLLKKDYSYYIEAKIKEVDSEYIKDLNVAFFSEVRKVIDRFGFEDRGKYEFSTEKDTYYIENYVNMEKGMKVVAIEINQTKIYYDEDTKEERTSKSVVFKVETYLDNGSCIISTSDTNPEYFINSENKLVYRYPALNPEEIINEHENVIQSLGNGKKFDYGLLNESFISMNEREGKELVEYQVKKGILKDRANGKKVSLTLKGAIRWMYLNVKYILFDKWKYGKNYYKQYFSSHVKTLPKSETKNGFASKIVIVIGILLTLYGLFDVYQGIKSDNWYETKGEIISFSVIESFDDIDVDIYYEYEVDGKVYENSTIYAGRSTKSEAEVDRLGAKYSKTGTIVDVYYNPDNTSESVLEKGSNFYTFWPIIMGVIILFYSIKSR